MPYKRPPAPHLEIQDPTDPLTEPPPPPRHFSEDAVATWYNVAQDAIAIGTLRGVDLHALAMLVEQLTTASKMTARLEAEGYTVPSTGGGCRQHPAVRIRLEAHRTAMRLLKQFGLMPQGREDASPFGLGTLSGLGGFHHKPT